MTRYVWTIAVLAYCALIYYLSDQTRLPVPELLDFKMSDKLMHASAYAVMAFFFWQAGKAWMLHLDVLDWRILALLCVLLCSLYGISDEWHQSFTVGRDASVFDWMADTIGALLLTMMLQKREFMSLQRQ